MKGLNTEYLKAAEDLQPQLVEFCRRTIETKSNSGEEKEVAELFAAEMEKLGYDEVFTDAWGNVVGIVKGTHPGPVIMYNGHMDAVDAGDPAQWEGYDPYIAVIDEQMMENPFTEEMEKTEVIHGRGSADLKCNLASQVYAGGVLAKMKREGADFKGVFLLTAVVLEENGEMMETVKLCEETLPAYEILPDAMVCCEPSSLKLMLGHRGRMEIRVEVRGKSCHGSSPWLGINAVEKSAELMKRVRTMMDTKTEENPYLGKPGIALTMYRCEPNELCIVPNKAVLIYDRRLIPGETAKSALEEIRTIADEIQSEDPEFDAEVSVNRNYRKAYTGIGEEIDSQKDVWIIDREHPFIRACREGLKEIGEPIKFDYWAFSTDTPQLGTIMHKPVIGYGPGQEYLIHTPQEKVRLDFLKRSLKGYIAMYLKASECPIAEMHT